MDWRFSTAADASSTKAVTMVDLKSIVAKAENMSSLDRGKLVSCPCETSKAGLL